MSERGISASVINQENFSVTDWLNVIHDWPKDRVDVVGFVTLLDPITKEDLFKKSLSAKAKDRDSEVLLQEMVDLLSLSDEALKNLLGAIQLIG